MIIKSLDTNEEVTNWDVNDVVVWLKDKNFEIYSSKFTSHGINGRALVMLDEDDIKQLVDNIGDRKNLYFHLKVLKSSIQRERITPNGRLHSESGENDSIHQISGYICEKCLKKIEKKSDLTNVSVNEANILNKSEKLKTFVSVIYLFLASVWSAFMLTVVHDRVPDMTKYPPLPDIILDNVPLINFAFYWTETIGLILMLTLLIILYFHKFRWVIFRRLCSLGGTIFLLRSITMLITSLSVPGAHIQCESKRYGSFINKIKGAWNIAIHGGLSVHGIRTCGDYMFSGHTVWLTMATHFICEYTPYTLNFLHTGVWVMNLFGLFFILAAHEHYSIDVFIAFYITSRMFLYYHSLANNKVLLQRDNRRVKIWFPLFSYFEQNIHSQIPNEFEDATPNMLKSIFKKTVNFVFRRNKKHD